MAKIVHLNPPMNRTPQFSDDPTDVTVSLFFDGTPFAKCVVRPPLRRAHVDTVRRVASDLFTQLGVAINESEVVAVIERINAVVFTELSVRPHEPGIVAYRSEFGGVGFVELCAMLVHSTEDEWRQDPALYGALSLVYSERQTVANFFLPPHLRA